MLLSQGQLWAVWGEERVVVSSALGGISLGGGCSPQSLFFLESPGNINPFVNRTLPMVSAWVHPSKIRTRILIDAPAAQNQRAVPTHGNSDRQTEQRNIPLFLHLPLLPGRPGGAVFLLRVGSAGTSAPPRETWASLPSPFPDPLSGIPSLPAGRYLLLPLVRRAQHHQARPPGTRIPVQPP